MSHTYAAPATLDEALELLAATPGARPVAGGTDLVVGARQGKAPLPDALVAIHGIDELDWIDTDPQGGLRIGALATHATIEASALVSWGFAALADSCALVGSPATRAAGTLGGNLANASPAMETGAPLLVHEAVCEVRSRGSSRQVAVADLWQGPGRSTLAPGELITEVTLPAPPPRAGSAYLRLEYRRAMEIAIVGAAALVALDPEGPIADASIADARIALTAVAPTIIRAPEAEQGLRGAPPTPEALAAAAATAAQSASPISDVRGSAAYRTAMVETICRRALQVALRRARGEPVSTPAAAHPEAWSADA